MMYEHCVEFRATRAAETAVSVAADRNGQDRFWARDAEAHAQDAEEYLAKAESYLPEAE
jgi:hypothetical protein